MEKLRTMSYLKMYQANKARDGFRPQQPKVLIYEIKIQPAWESS